MNNFKYKFYQFMSGRYGSDNLSMFLLVVSIILLVLNLFIFQNVIFSALVWAILILNVYRTYSRNIYKRKKENDMYLQATSPIRKKVTIVKKQSQDKQNRYFACPSCKQLVRVPRGKGQITITCPSCKTKFDRKS